MQLDTAEICGLSVPVCLDENGLSGRWAGRASWVALLDPYDGGNSWRVYQLPAAEGSLVFYGIYQGWYSKTAATGSSYLWNFGNVKRGENWESHCLDSLEEQFAVYYRFHRMGVVEYEGHYAMVKTGDGGFTWEQIFPVVDPRKSVCVDR